MSTQPLPIMTAAKYLELEREADFRSEFIQGQVYAMSGASQSHVWIAGNVQGLLFQQLRGKPCGATANDLRIYVANANVYTYPDVAVICGPWQFADGRRDTVTDAKVIIEVLSKSTQNYDRGEKFEYYRNLPSFSEYLLLRQDRMGAEHYRRQEDGSWVFREIGAPEAEIRLDSIGCVLILKDLYDRVEFAPANPAPDAI